jgi:uncharacterized membrane protein YkvA (DUF1232 family)
MLLLRVISATRRALPRIVPLLRDVRVPLWLKLASCVAALLILSPLDLFGDIPIVGALDDALLLALVVNGFVRAASSYALAADFVRADPPMRRARPIAVRQIAR